MANKASPFNLLDRIEPNIEVLENKWKNRNRIIKVTWRNILRDVVGRFSFLRNMRNTWYNGRLSESLLWFLIRNYYAYYGRILINYIHYYFYDIFFKLLAFIVLCVQFIFWRLLFYLGSKIQVLFIIYTLPYIITLV
jgi:hypothetical protein